MSSQTIEKFLLLVRQTPGLQEEIQRLVAESRDWAGQLVALARQQGYVITAEEWLAVYPTKAQGTLGELNEKQLDALAGGTSLVPVPTGPYPTGPGPVG